MYLSYICIYFISNLYQKYFIIILVLNIPKKVCLIKYSFFDIDVPRSFIYEELRRLEKSIEEFVIWCTKRMIS